MSSMYIFEKMDRWIEEDNDRFRQHLGMSGIGDDDERKSWLNFRWSLPSPFKGRMLRLFDLGNHIEDQMVDFITKSGVIDISAVDAQGKQYRASFIGGHFGGSCDGFVKRVLEENPDEVLVFECKSANDKRFKELEKMGDYEGWSKAYQWQLHCYMGCFGLKKALAVVVNKNTSEIYSEVVDFNPHIWEEAQERATRIITSDRPPDGMHERDWRLKNQTPQYRDTYLGNRLPPSVNCRNCKSCSPVIDGTDAAWFCTRSNRNLTLEEQKKGCPDHLWNPHMVKADMIEEESTEDMVAYRAGMWRFHNVIASLKGEMKFTSPEMRELSKTNYDFVRMKEMLEARDQFDGEFTQIEVTDEDNTPF